jgi:hypothetical protein
LKKYFLELKIPPLVVFLTFGGLMWLLSFAIPEFAFALPAKSLPGTVAANSFH